MIWNSSGKPEIKFESQLRRLFHNWPYFRLFGPGPEKYRLGEKNEIGEGKNSKYLKINYLSFITKKSCSPKGNERNKARLNVVLLLTKDFQVLQKNSMCMRN